jgi:type I site-specific restriction-modification system R (restriction) subunit
LALSHVRLNESIVEDAALEWLGELGYEIGQGPHFAPGEPTGERDSFGAVVLAERLREAIRRLNSAIPEEAREEALRKVLRVGTPSLTQTNRAFHRLLRDGVPVEYQRADGSIAGDHVKLVDFDAVGNNNRLAVSQFTVIEGQHNRRPDIVIFVNALPLGLIELKNAADEDATIWSAYAQVQTYKAEIPSLLHYNAALVVSDGLQARIGSLTANQEWFKVWRTIDGEGDAPKTTLELEVLVRGVFERRRFLDLLQHFIVFEEDPDSGALHKIIAGYQRRNIIVIADEAHRSQYDLIDGLARHVRDALPQASFIGFTGTPIEKTDANTRAVFGDYISIYDIQRAVADKATVPIYYESRISKLSLNAAALPKLDEEFEEITEESGGQGNPTYRGTDQAGERDGRGDEARGGSWPDRR